MLDGASVGSVVRGGLVVVLACAAILATASAVASVGAKEVAPTAVPHPDVEVFMKVAATPAQVAAVKRLVRETDAVRRFAFLDHAAAFAEFQQVFHGMPDMLGKVTAGDLPESFRLQLTRRKQAPAVVRRFRGRGGVGQVNGPPKSPSAEELRRLIAECRARDFDIEVFMRVDATQEQVDALQAEILEEGDVTLVRHLDHQDALKKFRAVVGGNAMLRDSLTAADLPESFELRVPPQRQAEVQTYLGRAAGVDTVIGPTPICQAVGHDNPVAA